MNANSYLNFEITTKRFFMEAAVRTLESISLNASNCFQSEFWGPLTNFSIARFIGLPYLVQAVQLSSLHHATE